MEGLLVNHSLGLLIVVAVGIFLQWRGVFKVRHGIWISLGILFVLSGLGFIAGFLGFSYFDVPFLSRMYWSVPYTFGMATTGVLAIGVAWAWKKHIPPRAEIFSEATSDGRSTSPSTSAPSTSSASSEDLASIKADIAELKTTIGALTESARACASCGASCLPSARFCRMCGEET
jgi:hypothetical protein